MSNFSSVPFVAFIEIDFIRPPNLDRPSSTRIFMLEIFLHRNLAALNPDSPPPTIITS